MDRRKFLQSGSLAIFAAATLPKAVRSMGKRIESDTSSYRSKANPALQTQTFYEIVINHDALDDFDTASDDDKVLTLKVAVIVSTQPTTPLHQGEFKYIIKTAKKADNDLWTITTKFDSKTSGDYTLDKSITGDLKMHCKEFNNMEILDKKGKKVLQTLDYYIPPANSTSGSGACFITTACVQHMQLADDCDTLTILRHLRDDFMKQTNKGNELVAQYQVIGPAIVSAIDSCDNRSAIYEHMYKEMILPSVELVKHGKPKLAVDHYTTFVKALMKAYV